MSLFRSLSLIQGEQLTEIVNRDGSICLLPHGPTPEPPRPFVCEDEVRTPPWMRKVDAPVTTLVTIEGAYVNIGGVRVPVSAR